MSGGWLTTAPNPRCRDAGFDAGQRGWKLHCIEGVEKDDKLPIRGKRSLCGILPRHGWSLDLFIMDRCQRCASRVSLATQTKAKVGTALPVQDGGADHG